MGFVPAAIVKFKVGLFWVILGAIAALLVVFVWAKPLTTEGQNLLAEVVMLPFLLMAAYAALKRKSSAASSPPPPNGAAPNTPPSGSTP